jgi:hypothetical protein
MTRTAEPPGFLHLFRWDPRAVAVPPRGNPLGARYKLGAFTCVMCRGLLEHLVHWDLDHGGDCPGRAEPAPLSAWLA